MIIFGTTFGWADLALALSVTFLSVGTAYLPSPRAKSICFSIPLPFSTAFLSIRQPVDATASIGFLTISAFVWIAWFLYTKKAWSILLAELVALTFYCSVSTVVPFFVPHSGTVETFAFWISWGIMLPLCLAMIVWLPPKQESHHKSPLPVPVKTLLIFLIVFAVVFAKSHIRGFMTAFPYVTCFAVYEGRHSLYTLARRMPTLLLSLMPVFLICRWLPEHIGYFGALAVSWAVYIPCFIALDRFYSRRDGALLHESAEKQAAAIEPPLGE
ncbi:MAG: hypothetical protein M0009_16620 [Deltaproteobacteria bacterium]|nr:hypothetical protein [Deltaproteobacteria bacterium]